MDTTVVNDYFTAFHECEKAVRQKKKKKKDVLKLVFLEISTLI